MTSDDQHFLDVLSSIPYQIGAYMPDIPFADEIDACFDRAGDSIRVSLSSTAWLPDFARPAPPPPPPRMTLRTPAPKGFFRFLKDWIVDHPALVSATVAFVGTGSFLLYRRKREYVRKRRARRTAGGAKTEVVVVAGTPTAPIPRSIIIDLERRGFIVYVIARSSAEEELIHSEKKQDIVPLHLNVTDPIDVQSTLSHFRQILDTPQFTSSTSGPGKLTLSGLVLIPDTTYPSGPVETISLDLWADALNAKILGTLTTAQAFLQLLSEYQSRVLILTPTIIPSLQAPFHSVETTVVGALEGFSASLRNELAPLNVGVHSIKFGTFDCSAIDKQSLRRDLASEVLRWPAHARAAYARNYIIQKGEHDGLSVLSGLKRQQNGSSLRSLNNAVFDALAQRRPWSVQRVGQGSMVYPLIGAVAPARMVRWMLGIEPVAASNDTGVGMKRRSMDSIEWEKVDEEEELAVGS